MGFKFNPFSGTFDATGASDAAPFAGQVDAYADLPLDSTAALNSRWLVKNNSGTWPFSSYKQAGIYIRANTVGASRDNDYQFVGTLPSVMNDNEFLIYDDADATKNLKFQLSGITTGTTRTLTVPNANGTIARTEDFASPPAIGSTTPSTGAFTTLTASTATVSPPASLSNARGIQWTGITGTFGEAAVYAHAPGAANLGIGIRTGNPSTNAFNQVANFTPTGMNSTAIGSTTPSTGAFTTLSASPTFDLTSAGSTANETPLTITHGRAALGDSLRLLFRPRGAGNPNASAEIIARDPNTAGIPFCELLIRVQNGERVRFPLTTPNQTSAGTIFAENIALASGGTMTTPDVLLFRDGAANILGLRNAASAQTFRLYNTFTSTTNFERLNLIAQTSGSFIIGTEKGSAGGTARALELRTDNVARLTIGSGGGFTLADAQDIAIGTTTGTKIGTATTQKIGFFDKTPVVQPTAVADATDAATVITQLNALLSRMRDLGLIAT